MQSLEIQIVDQILVRGKIAYYTKKQWGFSMKCTTPTDP